MTKAAVHLFGGWAYSPHALQPLADGLNEHFDVTNHPFTADHTAIIPTSPCIIVGWSLGALHALEFIRSSGMKPDALVLISGTSRFCSGDDYPHGTDRAMLKSMIIGMRRSREQTLHGFYELAGEDKPQTADFSSSFSDDELKLGLKQLDSLDVRESLSLISPPVLILHGSADRIIPCSASEYLNENLPNAQIVINKDAGHDLPRRHPNWVVEKILSYSSGIINSSGS